MPNEPKPKTVLLDGTKMTSIETIHQHVADVLSFPSYYGHNLDALWDVLTEINDPVHIKFTHLARLHQQLPDWYSARFLRCQNRVWRVKS